MNEKISKRAEKLDDALNGESDEMAIETIQRSLNEERAEGVAEVVARVATLEAERAALVTALDDMADELELETFVVNTPSQRQRLHAWSERLIALAAVRVDPAQATTKA